MTYHCNGQWWLQRNIKVQRAQPYFYSLSHQKNVMHMPLQLGATYVLCQEPCAWSNFKWYFEEKKFTTFLVLQLDVHLGVARDILAVMGDIETEDEDSMVDEVSLWYLLSDLLSIYPLILLKSWQNLSLKLSHRPISYNFQIKYKIVTENSAGKLLSVLLSSVESVRFIDTKFFSCKLSSTPSKLFCQALIF